MFAARLVWRDCLVVEREGQKSRKVCSVVGNLLVPSCFERQPTSIELICVSSRLIAPGRAYSHVSVAHWRGDSTASAAHWLTCVYESNLNETGSRMERHGASGEWETEREQWLERGVNCRDMSGPGRAGEEEPGRRWHP